MTQRMIGQVKWPVSSRTATLYVDGEQVARCSCTRYDLVAGCLAEWLSKTYSDRLIAIRQRAETTFFYPVGRRDKRNARGLPWFYITVSEKKGKTIYSPSINGFAGLEIVQNIGKAVGIEIVLMKSRKKGDEIYLITDKRAKEQQVD